MADQNGLSLHMLVVLSQESSRASLINQRETQAVSEVARLLGCRVYTIPPNFDQCGNADNALAYLPVFDTPVPGMWVGVIPDFDYYSAIYHSALKKNVCLVNTPEQHRLAMRFDLFYPYLQGLTPKSIVIDDPGQIAQIVEQLSFPVFVKGANQIKQRGRLARCDCQQYQ